MCGIAGMARRNGPPIDRHNLYRMCDALVARGPDEGGYFLDASAALGVRRLSIIDLEGGSQPVHDEERATWAVLNGEIYNYRELREGLERQGHRFRTHSDTEVIVHLYEEHGKDFVHHVRGMFGIAVWDQRRRRLVLARDRLGIKPLFYGECGGQFVFASELKSVLQHDGAQVSLSWRAIDRLLTALTTPVDESIVAGIHKLEPGHTLTLDPDRPPSIERYWEVPREPIPESDFEMDAKDTAREVERMLEESVRVHMVSDVPVGAFLSGGADSSSIVALMRRYQSGVIKTFSVGYSDPRYDESGDARLVAERFGTVHHELRLEPNVLDMLDDFAWHMDEPFGDSSAIPTFIVSKLASEHVKVVLSGDGGDELFAGYEKYMVEARERRYDRVPASVRSPIGVVASMLPHGMRGRNYLRHASLDGARRYLDASTLFPREEKRRLLTEEAFCAIRHLDSWSREQRYLEAPGGDWLSRAQYSDLLSYLPLDILTKVDRMSSANSLEARVPFLDHKFVEFAARIPTAMKLRGTQGKWILKQAMERVLPSSTLNKRKQGFAVPLDSWFRGRLEGQVRELLLSSTSRARGIFDPKGIESLVRLHASGRNMDLHLWTLISFELWCRQFLDAGAHRRKARPEDAGKRSIETVVA